LKSLTDRIFKLVMNHYLDKVNLKQKAAVRREENRTYSNICPQAVKSLFNFS
jgi:hypothetical protein